MRPEAVILTALRGSGERPVAGTELAQTLGISRAAIWAHIQELRQVGYEIEASPHRGYRLLKSPDCLLADDLLARIGSTTVLARDIRVFQETTSTNDIADRMGRDGVREGAVVFAESQTQGRGRMGRSWQSLAGRGLWFSILLRPHLPPIAATRITIAAATAVARAIRQETRLAVRVKWPNDLLISNRKVAGILTELTAELDHTKYVVLGVGLDVNQRREDFPVALREVATSLREEAGRPVDRPALAARVLQELDRDYARLQRGLFESVADEWEGLCTTLGREVTIHTADQPVRGRAESLDADGALLVRTQHGRLHRVIGGDVIVERA